MRDGRPRCTAGRSRANPDGRGAVHEQRGPSGVFMLAKLAGSCVRWKEGDARWARYRRAGGGGLVDERGLLRIDGMGGCN